MCEPAQPKCDDFVRKLTGKMSGATDTTSIEHRALTLSVRTPQCGHTAWGKTVMRRPTGMRIITMIKIHKRNLDDRLPRKYRESTTIALCGSPPVVCSHFLHGRVNKYTHTHIYIYTYVLIRAIYVYCIIDACACPGRLSMLGKGHGGKVNEGKSEGRG